MDRDNEQLDRGSPEDAGESSAGSGSAAAIEVGQTLKHYRILAELGRGGMGEVYRAEDTSLKRQVALKVLPAGLAGDPQRLERFQREAEAIASLNHPSIVTIHSIEQDQGIRFLTMELVDGESLDRVLARSKLPLDDVAELIASLAKALAAAHEKGIVHRDLKPGNVMLPRQGGVKILDFGLAKVSAAEAIDDTEAATQLATLTREGVVVGTAAYMSPEQALGKPVDTRSDIFSLGSMLYEAATGTRPFRGDSSVDLLHQIIHHEPPPLSETLPEAPLELQWILRKALAKDPGERYQTARDLAVDLQNLQRDLKSDSTSASVASVASRPAATATAPANTRARQGPRLVTLGLVAIAIVAALGTTWWAIRGRKPESADPTPTTASLSLKKLTSSGQVISAAISPDGKFFTYVETTDREGQILWVQQVSGRQSLELRPVQDVGYWSLGFSHDGSEILYATKGASDRFTGALYRVSTLGGQPRKVGPVAIDSVVALSHDGERLAWLRAQHPDPDSSSLIVARADGSDERTLATVSGTHQLVPRFFTGPAWSPDGRVIAATVASSDPGGMTRLVGFDTETGAVAWTHPTEWIWATHAAWLPDASELLLVGAREMLTSAQIWRVPVPTGEPVQVTNDLMMYRMVTLTADGQQMMAVAAATTGDIWSYELDGSTLPRKISSGTDDGYFGFELTPDDRIIYSTFVAGQYDLAIMNLDGSQSTTLTSTRANEVWPRLTPDGRIVYYAVTGSGAEVRRMDFDGGDQTTLTAAAVGTSMTLDVSPDGEWIYFDNLVKGYYTIWRVPVAGGEATQVLEVQARRAAVSPDGSRIAFFYRESGNDFYDIGIAPAAGGEIELILDESGFFARSFIRWSEDGESLLINSRPTDRANLWRLPLDGGDPVKLTDFHEPRLSWVEFVDDGNTMIFLRTAWARDAILIENFR